MPYVELELERFARLEEIMGTRLPEILDGVVRSLSAAIEQLEAAIGSGELDRAAKAAHAARNDALMVGAKPLLASLTEAESSARDGRADDASDALAGVRDAWPRTREELQRLALES